MRSEEMLYPSEDLYQMQNGDNLEARKKLRQQDLQGMRMKELNKDDDSSSFSIEPRTFNLTCDNGERIELRFFSDGVRVSVYARPLEDSAFECLELFWSASRQEQDDLGKCISQEAIS
jgi:hypothetical protein